MHTASHRVLLVVALFTSSLAHADSREPRRNKPSTLSRLSNATTLNMLPDGTLISNGSSRLQVLRPGAKVWKTLLDQKGDNLYRIAFDRSGRVLAAWEKDPLLHLFSADGKQHTTIPKPGSPEEDVYQYRVEHLAFLPNGRDAFVFAEGEKLRGSSRNYAFRIALDGKSAPELVYQVDGGSTLDFDGTLALLRIPVRPEQMCEWLTCDPVKEIVAYELLDQGFRRTTLLSNEDYPIGNARLVWGSKFDPVVMEVPLHKQGRLMLSWRRGEPKAHVRPFPKGDSRFDRLFATPAGEVFELVRHGDSYLQLDLRRYSLEGGDPQVTTLTYPRGPLTREWNVHAFGARKDGTLWLHWGDYLLLFAQGKRPVRYNLEPMITRGFEWADATVYQASPEVLWVGLDGRARDYVRVSFDEVEKKAKPF